MSTLFRIILLFLLMISASCTLGDKNTDQDLNHAFLFADDEAKPWVYWYWMNGNVTKEGISADIKAMSDVGIGGAFLMCIGGPWERPGLDTAYTQLSRGWWGLVDHAFREAERMGVEIGMSACDGWATAGGPQIRAKDAMKKIVWSLTPVAGGKRIARYIPEPPQFTGTYQDAGQELTGDRKFYRDVACYAFPAPEGINKNMSDYHLDVKSDIPDIEVQKLFDGNTREIAVNTQRTGYIQVGFEEPFTARSVRLFSQADRWFPYPFYAASMELQTSNDGREFRHLCRLTPDQHGWQDDGTPVTIRIPETTARYFRFIFTTETDLPLSMRYVGSERKYLSLTELELSPVAWIDHFEAKAAFRYRLAPPTDTPLQQIGNIPLKDMVQISEYLDSTGFLSWEAPEGNWTILRMGYTITGNENETGGGGVGLESDKFSKEATRLVFDGWLAETIRQVGKGRNGPLMSLMHVDSWEAGTQNWTDDFVGEFADRRGYDPLLYLPALAGLPLESYEVYENFLYDFRLTIIELLNENFYQEITALAHQNGSQFSAEATAPVMVSDGMLHHKYIDRPMGEFWRDDPTPMDKPEDILEAVSGAHIYGKPIIQAEAFTDVDSKWYEYPWLLKKQGDYNFCRGINKFFLHVYVQQPFVGKKPGFTLGQTGLHFNRGQVWWNQAKPWIDYLTTCQSMLQQGTRVADILCFSGMAIPRRGLLPDQLGVAIPTGYHYLTINPDGLLNQVTVENGRMKLPNGATHPVLLLPDDPFLGGGKYSVEILRKLDELIRAGVIVVGPKPAGLVGLKDFLTGDIHLPALEKYPWTDNINEALSKAGIAPDFTHKGADSIDFIHKLAGKSQFYFLSNQKDVSQEALCSFRVSGQVAEIWNPLTGERFVAEMETREENSMEDGRAEIRLKFRPYESLFVVFNETVTPRLKKAPTYHPVGESSVSGTWSISFEKDRGLPEDYVIHSDTLFSLIRHLNPDVRHFSGTIRYEVNFHYKEDLFDPETRYDLNLGEVANMAQVWLNGKDLGLVWTKPCVTDISGALMAGMNHLVIEVTNTWNNRIVRDMELPYEQRISYFPHYEEYRQAGDKNGFLIRSVDYDLRDAGLIGPCTIISRKVQTSPAMTPEWAKNLVIYEIATKSFTSPNGPESGTFNSLKAKIPYLKDLGINAIWLSGHSLAHPTHFYNVWTQYACYDPGILDPSLGSKEEFKALIDAAHESGIRVFLDVITHGVMNESDLVKQHPEWFEGVTQPWNMNDFKWDDEIPELDKWWVDTWVSYVLDYGVDGYRLDLSGERHDLWREVRRQCAEAGREIVLYSEGAELIGDTYDFTQSYLKLLSGHGVEHFTPLRDDVARYVLSRHGRETEFSVLISYEDGAVDQFFTLQDPKEMVILDDHTDEVSFWGLEPDGLQDRHFQLTVDPDKKIKSIQLQDASRGIWFHPVNNRNYVLKMKQLSRDCVEIVAGAEDNLRPDGVLSSNEFSCHDNGWEGFPRNKSPFVAEGSRALFGYSAIFVPSIPVFMSGEEFNCDFRSLPTLSPHLFGRARPGEGTWLYGNWIDWSQLLQPEKQAMLADVKKMIAIRKKYADIICARPVSKQPNIAPVAVSGKESTDLPVPYVQWDDKHAIVVIANPGNTIRSIVASIAPACVFGWAGIKGLKVTNIWSDGRSVYRELSPHGILEIPVSLPADKEPGGGLAIFLIERD